MNISPASFGKKYISKVPVQNNQTGKKEVFNFVQYDSKEDIPVIKDASINWSQKKEPVITSYNGYFFEVPTMSLNSDFVDNIVSNMEKNKFLKGHEFYGLENKNNEIQALCEVKSYKSLFSKDASKKEEKIEYLTVNPKSSYGARGREYSKLGTIMFRKIVKLAKDNNVKCIKLLDCSDGFWAAMPYVTPKDKYKIEYRLFEEDYDKCLKKLDETI